MGLQISYQGSSANPLIDIIRDSMKSAIILITAASGVRSSGGSHFWAALWYHLVKRGPGKIMGLHMKLKTTPERSRLMARVRQSGTSAELALRRLVHSCGFRFRVKAKDLPGTPDLVNRNAKWAIFVHGCFWHAHIGCSLWSIPKNNQPFWRRKFLENRSRDERKVKELENSGYSVLIVWGCELQSEAKTKRKILKFMERVYRTRASKIKGKVQSPGRLRTKSKDSEKELYRYSASRKYVSRTVRLDNGKTYSTRLDVGKHPSPSEDPHSAFDQAFLRKARRHVLDEGHPAIRGVDLFCGCGGLSVGAREACLAAGYRFESVLAIDEDSLSLEVYKANFNPSQTYNCDIVNIVDGKSGTLPTPVERVLLKGLGKINILLAGPPCQGHSDLNNRTRRRDRRNKLYERVGRFAEITEPEHILIENVPTVIHARDRALDNTIELLEKHGYEVDTGIVDLSQFGVPQRRKRHVLVASLIKSLSVANVVDKYRVFATRDIRWAIGDLEQEEANGVFTESSKHSQDNLRRINYLFKHDLYDLPNQLRPPCHQDGGHSYISMYGRLKYDEPAQTITSGFGSPGQGRFIHPSQSRTLTPHEAARLQFFPDSFDFSGVTRRTALANMIGNAVPMKLSYVFCLELLS